MVRNSFIFCLITTCNLLLIALLSTHAHYMRKAGAARLQTGVELVRDLRLTDLCLFTEARYTRHPAMADMHTPFQDHPFGLDHFPSGSLVPPPVHLTRRHE